MMATVLFVIGFLVFLFAGVAVYGAATKGYDDPNFEAARFIGKVAAIIFLAAIAAKYVVG
jgi:hypothetical protein